MPPSSEVTQPMSSLAATQPLPAPPCSATTGISLAIPGPISEHATGTSDARVPAMTYTTTGLQSLMKEELKFLIKDSNLVVALTNKQRTKDDLVAAVLAAPAHQQPSSDSIASILEQHKVKKAAGKLKIKLKFGVKPA
ncbi:hypothetical protein L208DRAFT_1383186 [Tricholoma matsutake]|nr:hypothetical protein L208DRAFT_1383186 [Tricholoma matsutake 945]